MTAQIKVKVQRKAIVKLKVLPRFPTDVVADPGIIITRSGQTYTFSLDATALPSAALQALADNTGTGLWAITGAGTGHVRTITGTAAEITVTFGDGVSGNPTISIPAAVTFTGKTVTGGTYSGATLTTPSITGAFPFRLRSQGANAFDIEMRSTDTITANRTVFFNTGDSNRSVAFGGNIATGGDLTTAAALTTSGAFAATFTFTGITTVTFPTTGTLATTSNKLSAFAATTSAELAGVISDETGSGALVFATSPTLITPALGTPASGVLTNATGLPISTGVAGLGTGVATFLATPSSANLRAALTDEVGTGAAYFVGGALGTPASATLTNATGLPLSGLTTQAAWSFVVNNTSSAAVPTAVDIGSLTSKASPAAGDFIILSDQAASGALKRATVSSVASAGSVSSINGQTGALLLKLFAGGRLTLQTATPVMSTSQTTKTTVYYTPYIHDQIMIYDGTNFIPTTFTELSQATTDTTKSPAAVATGNAYDVFVWNDSGTIRATRGPTWSSGTAGSNTVRGTGAGSTDLIRVNGVLLNANAITNGPAAQRGTYVGTIYSDASNAISFTFGSAAAGGGAGMLGVWNNYNRVAIDTMVTETNATWGLSSATIRAVNGSTNNRVTFVAGFAEDNVRASYMVNTSFATSGQFCEAGFALDSTTVEDKAGFVQGSTTTSAGAFAIGSYGPLLGLHFIQATEKSDGTNLTTFSGGKYQGLTVGLRM